MEIKKLSKYFIIVFLIAFFTINWNEVSWVFNYRAISGIVSEFFQKEQILAGPNFEYSKEENSIEIPKIDIKAPLIVNENMNNDDVSKALDSGVVHYPSSVLPGNEGQTIILGHSAPLGWPKIQYQWVFSNLNDLEPGDKIFVHLDNKKYSFSVKNKVFLERGEELPTNLTNSNNVLVLISCWPPGKDLKRIAVVAI